MEETMVQNNTQRADESEESQSTSFSNKPVVLADNGHSTKVKLWTNKTENGEFHTVSIERSFKRQGSEQWETQKVNLNAEDLLAVARGLEKGHDTIVEKQIGKQGQTRA
jgi:hypothetical protein